MGRRSRKHSEGCRLTERRRRQLGASTLALFGLDVSQLCKVQQEQEAM